MIKNEPFEKLLLSYRPVQKVDHYPPRLSFGFAIPKEFVQFRQVALENALADPEKLDAAKNFFTLQSLVMPFLNERCGLAPGSDEAIDCGYIQSLEGALVLELGTNYQGRVPKEKAGAAIRVIKELFHLPSDTKPKWYLEADIDLKAPDEYLLPSKSPFPTTAWRRV